MLPPIQMTSRQVHSATKPFAPFNEWRDIAQLLRKIATDRQTLFDPRTRTSIFQTLVDFPQLEIGNDR
jgi:hypothetical protein